MTTDKDYLIKGVDLGMLLVADTVEDVKEVVERCIARGPLRSESICETCKSEIPEHKCDPKCPAKGG